MPHAGATFIRENIIVAVFNCKNSSKFGEGALTFDI
jgi:hypothetical protein